MSDRKPAANTDETRTQQLCLTAWELASTEGDESLSPQAAAMVMRAEEKLQAELERLDGVEPALRSQIRVHPDADAAVLLVHGSTGNPGDLRGLADHLFERRLTVANVLLPGHGTGDADRIEVRWKTCLHEIRLRYGALARAYDKVHVVGFSFGAALALHLAAEVKPRSLTLLSAALNPRVSFRHRIMLMLGLHRLPFLRRRLGWDLEVFDAMSGAKPLAGKLDLPIYAAHCEDDPRVDPSSLRHLQKKARHRNSRFRIFPTGGHMILEAHGRETLHREIADFVARS